MLVLYQQSCSRRERSHWVCKCLVHRHHRLSQLATGLQDLGTTKLMVTTWMEVSMHLDSRWLKDNLLRYCVGGACLMMLHEKCHGNRIYSKWGIHWSLEFKTVPVIRNHLAKNVNSSKADDVWYSLLVWPWDDDSSSHSFTWVERKQVLLTEPNKITTEHLQTVYSPTSPT